MKLSLVTSLAASAALVSAVPMRVVVVSGSADNVALPHAGHAGDDSVANVAKLMPPAPEMADAVGHDVKWMTPNVPGQSDENSDEQHKPAHHHHARPCPGRFRGKMIALANSFRGTFGLPPLEDGARIHGGVVKITGMKLMGGPQPIVPHPHHHHHGHHGFHMRPFHHQGSSFLGRVHVALMTLGPWEGRAVAFVLGCGLGVLLRMMWVLAVVTVRAIKGERSDEDEEGEYTHIIYEYTDIPADAEEIAVPPPQYGYPVDEKKPVEEAH